MLKASVLVKTLPLDRSLRGYLLSTYTQRIIGRSCWICALMDAIFLQDILQSMWTLIQKEGDYSQILHKLRAEAMNMAF